MISTVKQMFILLFSVQWRYVVTRGGVDFNLWVYYTFESANTQGYVNEYVIKEQL